MLFHTAVSKAGLGTLVASFILMFGAGNALATIIDGDFATGDLTGWTNSAHDAFDQSLDSFPFTNVATVGAHNVAQLKTGEFADGLFIATLEQSFGVSAEKPILNFDFILPTTLADSTGTGTSSPVTTTS